MGLRVAGKRRGDLGLSGAVGGRAEGPGWTWCLPEGAELEGGELGRGEVLSKPRGVWTILPIKGKQESHWDLQSREW